MEQNSRKYVNQIIDLLGIDINMCIDPQLVKDIFSKDMMLDGFTLGEELLAKAFARPIPLKPMFEKTIHGILTKQPAICDFIQSAIEKDFVVKVSTPEAEEIIKRAVNHAYILNELTKEIVINIDFVFRIQDHLIEQRAKFGISKNFVEALEVLKVIYKGSMFEPTKIIGMDMVYKARALCRRKGYMTEEDVKAQVDGLKLNVLEASITDKQAGYMDNAIVGGALAVIPAKNVSLTDDKNKIMLFHLSRKWVSLYETWNLAFCLGNLSYLQVILPKLLIPEVIDAEHDEYLINRSAALWMTTLFHQFAVLTKRVNVEIPNRKELAKLWGEINLRYAMDLVTTESENTMKDCEEVLSITMGEIMEYMKKSMTELPLSNEDAERLAKVYS